MINLREIYTEEMDKRIHQSSKATIEEAIAFIDTTNAIKKLLSHSCFYPIRQLIDLDFESFETNIIVNEHERLLWVLENDSSYSRHLETKYKIDSIPSSELLEKVIKPTSKDYSDLTVFEITELIEYANHLMYLTSYDLTNFFLVRVFVSLLLLDMTEELFNRGIAHA